MLLQRREDPGVPPASASPVGAPAATVATMSPAPAVAVPASVAPPPTVQALEPSGMKALAVKPDVRPSVRATSRPPTAAAVPATPVPAPAPPRPTSPPQEEEGTGLLQIAAIPWGQVSVDGKVMGTTPLDRIPLGAGRHTILVRHPAYEDEERTVTIRSGQVEKVVINFPTQGVRKQP